MMNVVSAHHNVDCRMQLDAGNLRAAELLHIVDMMNVVVFNQ